jgi:hypothetical protein
LDEPETKKIVKTERYLGGIIREVDDHCLRRAPARLPSASSVARRLLPLPAIGFWRCVGDGGSRLRFAKV